MTTRTTTRKTTPPARSKPGTILKDLPVELLTPEQFEAVTKANYHHPDSRLVLSLFLNANYFWQIARKMQNKPSPITSIDWALIEKNTAALISNSLSKLLSGIDRQPWQVEACPVEPKSKTESKTKSSKLQSCGCRDKHSQAAGVVEACKLGKRQGNDESWTGY
jgi:hypothetical protein